METKYIFVTGGVDSSIGKGIISSSLALLLLSRGFRVTIQKFDSYFNIDSGTLNPYEHGECYVTADGHEADLDLGHYERFTNIETSSANNITLGRIYQNVLNKERRGDYLGKTVQVVPHITDEIKRNIKALGLTGKYDFIIIEIGGIVGDIESLPFIEAVRQLKWELKHNCMSIHLTYIPYFRATKELKMKPTQHSVKELQSRGIQPDVLVLRTENEVPIDIRQKIALLCNVEDDAVIQSVDVSSIYEVPMKLQEQRFDEIVLRKTGTSVAGECDLAQWKQFLARLDSATEEITIGLVGKYVELQDAYKSISEALMHAAVYHDRKLDVRYISSENLNDGNVGDALKDLDGVIIAPGFGNRGVEGKFVALKWCRENDMPTLGICLGMQSMVIEFARNVLGYAEANSSEMDSQTIHNVIDLMEGQKNLANMGGTMRLGAYRCVLTENSIVAKAYGTTSISERHRHRFEFNNNYREQFEAAGMRCVGINPDTNLVEIVEVEGKTWYVGTQYHPEYSSTVLRPSPLFMDFIRAVIEKENINK